MTLAFTVICQHIKRVSSLKLLGQLQLRPPVKEGKKVNIFSLDQKFFHLGMGMGVGVGEGASSTNLYNDDSGLTLTCFMTCQNSRIDDVGYKRLTSGDVSFKIVHL